MIPIFTIPSGPDPLHPQPDPLRLWPGLLGSWPGLKQSHFQPVLIFLVIIYF
jgi:hypothetical protein